MGFHSQVNPGSASVLKNCGQRPQILNKKTDPSWIAGSKEKSEIPALGDNFFKK
jgi:hypothetical protein